MITKYTLIRSTEPGYSGRLDLALFPGYTLDSLGTLVEAVITQAYEDPRVTTDAKARGYVYAEMYDQALTTAITRPGEIRLDNLGTKKLNTALLVSTLRGWIAQWSAEIEDSTPGSADDHSSSSVQITNRNPA